MVANNAANNAAVVSAGGVKNADLLTQTLVLAQQPPQLSINIPLQPLKADVYNSLSSKIVPKWEKDLFHGKYDGYGSERYTEIHGNHTEIHSNPNLRKFLQES